MPIGNSNFGMSFYGVMILFLLMTLIIGKFIKEKEKKIEFTRISSATIICGAIYAISLLILYLFTYSQEEAVKLASYTRYMSTFMLAIAIFLGFCAVNILNMKIRITKKEAIIFSLAIIMLLPVNTIIENTLEHKKTLQNIKLQREEYETITEYKSSLKQGDNIYYIDIGSIGFGFHVTRNNMLPIAVSGDWSIRTEKTKEDQYTTKEKTVENWEKELLWYDYVYVYYADELFKTQYASLFEDDIQNNVMYRIEKENDKVKLYKMR